jgi:hypothetical protein
MSTFIFKKANLNALNIQTVLKQRKVIFLPDDYIYCREEKSTFNVLQAFYFPPNSN